MTQEFVTLPREVVTQALDALEGCRVEYDYHGNPVDASDQDVINARNVLRAALEQSQGEYEPVGKLISDPYEGHIFIPYGDRWPFNEDLYIHPQPKREPLTDEEIQTLQGTINRYEVSFATAYGRAFEAAYGIGSKV